MQREGPCGCSRGLAAELPGTGGWEPPDRSPARPPAHPLPTSSSAALVVSCDRLSIHPPTHPRLDLLSANGTLRLLVAVDVLLQAAAAKGMA